MNQSIRQTTRVFGISTRRVAVSYHALQAFAAGLDACALIVGGIAAFGAYQFYSSGKFGRIDDGFGVGLVCAFLFIVLAQARRLYHRQATLNPWPSLKFVWFALAIAYLGLINFMFLLKVGQDYSRASVTTFGIFAFVLVTLERLALARFATIGVERGLIAGKKAVIIGEASELERLPRSELRHFGMEQIARIGVTRSEEGNGLSERGQAQVESAIALAREFHAAEFVLMIPWGHDRLIAEVGELLRSSPLAVKLLPDSTIRNFVGRQANGRQDPTLAVEIQREPLNRWELLLKRSVDLALSVGAVALLAPLFLITALAIKLDSKGPVLFRQRRVGFDNREFVIYKFRTMTTLEDGERIVQAHKGDSRITRIGKLLRRSSIDELPQLLNVIRGDMSIVGPRPHAVAHHDQYSSLIASYALRHHVKPGLTGLAQMRGFRGETRQLVQMERRVEQDLWYINHWSLPLDLMIMARTVLVLIRQEVY